MHYLGWEVITLGALHTSVVAGTFFVISFLLSATIADYKESEKIPADFAAITQNMYEDAVTIKQNYPKFDLNAFADELLNMLGAFERDVRRRTHEGHQQIHRLGEGFVNMEQAGVPPNYIVKFKTQQAQLTRSLLRVNYIQRIVFIPSATILSRAIVVIVIGLLLITEVEPFYAGMALDAIISLIFVYILILIQVISIPFHSKGSTQDDVSLFLIDQSAAYIRTGRD